MRLTSLKSRKMWLPCRLPHVSLVRSIDKGGPWGDLMMIPLDRSVGWPSCWYLQAEVLILPCLYVARNRACCHTCDICVVMNNHQFDVSGLGS